MSQLNTPPSAAKYKPYLGGSEMLTQKGQTKTSQVKKSQAKTAYQRERFSCRSLLALGSLLLTTLLTTPLQASETVMERVNYTKASHEENVEDLRVKVLGGYLNVRRYYRVMRRYNSDSNYNLGLSGAIGGDPDLITGNTLVGYRGNSLLSYRNPPTRLTGGITSGSSGSSGPAVFRPRKPFESGVWQFHRYWHDLILLDRDTALTRDPSKIQSIDRNDFIYVRKDGENVFHYEYNGADLRITLTDTGYRWSNRQGDWIDYDHKGRAIRSGDHNDVTINLERNAAGYIEHYKDHQGRIILTWSYDGNKPIKVEDYSGRTVHYTWSNHDLVSVTTSRGDQWQYGYSDFDSEALDDHRVLTSKTDPLGQTFRYDYEMSKGGYQTVGTTPSTSFDLIGEEGEVVRGQLTTNSGGRSGRVLTRALPKMLMHTGKVYPDGKRERYQYYYDDNSQTYMHLITNSDGYEDERWYDLDGQIRHRRVGGKIATTRVRSGSTAVTTDSYGNKTTVNYTRWEAIQSEQFADGTRRQYRYLPNYNFLTEVTDENGSKTRHDYDDKGNRIRTTLGEGSDDERIIEWEVDQYGQITTERIVDKQQPENTTQTYYQYDSYGNLTQLTDARGHNIDFNDYNAQGQYQTLIDSRNYRWRNTYDAHGNHLSSTSPLGYTTTNSYDKIHRLLEVTDAEKRRTQYGYDSRDQVTSITRNDGSKRTLRYRMDGLLSHQTDESGQVMDYRYDRSRRLIEITDGAGQQTRIDYDRGNELAGHRIARITTPNNQLNYTYDARHRVLSQTLSSIKGDGLSSTTRFSYNPRGERISVTDANGNTQHTTYTVHGEPATDTNAENETISYTWDARGNLTQVTDALNAVTRYTYDANNNRISATRPQQGSLFDAIQRYTYDASNQLLSITDYNGNRATYTWDKDQRLSQQNHSLAGQTAPDRSIRYHYDKTGLPTRYQDTYQGKSHQSDYRYDPLGRLQQQTTQFATANGSFSKTLYSHYTGNGQLKTKIDAENHRTDYHYDPAGKLLQIALQQGGSILVNDYEGQLPKTMTYPGGSRRQHDYDGLARLTRIQTWDNANNPTMDYHYQLDAVGNILEKITQQGTFTYQYDKAYRLTQADQANAFGKHEYSYDANSNRTAHNRHLGEQNNQGIQASYNSQQALTAIRQIVGETTTNTNLTYDNNGGVINNSENNASYRYNSMGRLESVHYDDNLIASYRYDPQGRRISKTANGSTTYYLYDESGAGLVGEYTESGELIRGYDYQPGTPFTTAPIALKLKKATVEGQPSQYEYSYYQHDHLGTPQHLFQISGALVWQGEYDAFGEIRESNTQVENPLRMAGQYHDRETGLYYNWHRYYDPKTGRYTKADPIGLRGGINTYGYVYQNPLSYIDPKGKNGVATGFGIALVAFCLRYPGACVAAVASLGCLLNGQACTLPEVSQDCDDGFSSGQPLLNEEAGDNGDPTDPLVTTTPTATGSPGDPNDPNNDDDENELPDNAKDMKELSKGEIKKLKRGGEDIHELKGKGSSRYDLFKDKNGDIYQVLKGGRGEPQPTYLNINNF